MNRNYIRSRNKEYQVFHILEKDYDLVVRASGSHGIADIIALRFPKECSYPNHYEVKLVQIKVSEKVKTGKIDCKIIDGHNLEIWKYPVKSKKWNKKFRNKK